MDLAEVLGMGEGEGGLGGMEGREDIEHIWVSFPRTGIGPELCPFLKKFGNLL